MNYSTATRWLLFSLLVFSPFWTACAEKDSSDAADETAGETGDTGETESRDSLYVSDEGRFRITFPDGGSLMERTVPVPTVAGQIDMHMTLADKGDYAFMTAYSDYPDSLLAAKDARSLLNDSRDGAVANVNGTRIEEKERDYEFQGYPAKEFFVRGEQEGRKIFKRANLILAGTRLYQVLYMAFDEADLESEQAEAFISSFNITAETTGDGEEGSGEGGA